uniref:Uncharacterized protein n=1 Tax=Echinococcus granulosus TaxID=6210 RepID=A0A068X134_ECHGR|nr:hypothetical protein EgrG_002044100 [Echinococcus granulosus]
MGFSNLSCAASIWDGFGGALIRHRRFFYFIAERGLAAVDVMKVDNHSKREFWVSGLPSTSKYSVILASGRQFR